MFPLLVMIVNCLTLGLMSDISNETEEKEEKDIPPRITFNVNIIQIM